MGHPTKNNCLSFSEAFLSRGHRYVTGGYRDGPISTVAYNRSDDSLQRQVHTVNCSAFIILLHLSSVGQRYILAVYSNDSKECICSS